MGSQELFDLKISSSVRVFFCVLISLKYALSLILLKKLSISFSCVALLQYVCVGQKFKFLPRSLYTLILKLNLDKLTTVPNGSEL